MAFDEKRYLDLTGLTTYDDDIKAWSNSVKQAGYKTVKRSASGNNLLFFKKPNAIVGTDVADESIDLSDAEAAIKLAALAVLVGAVWDGTNQRWIPSPSFDSSISATTIVSALNEVISDFNTKIGTIPSTSSATNIIDYINEQVTAGNVTGVKGDAEDEYRNGLVNLTPANIGAVSTTTFNNQIGNHIVNKDVPSDAKFTDTIYDDTLIANRITTVENLLDGHSVAKDVPEDAKFTDTTYESKSAVSGGTDVSLVTTGEKYTWNNKANKATTLAGYGITDAATSAQGAKADTAVQSVKIGSSSTEYKSGTTVTLPAYPSKTSDLTNDSNFVNDAYYVHTDNNYTVTDKEKLAGIATGAEVNQNAFSNVKIGNTTISADSKTDTLEFVAGNNVTLTPDATSDTVTINAVDTTYESKSAASGGTAVSLVTTGEKYIWNNKSNFSGNYNDLTNKPTLGTAAAKDIPSSGNASTTQVVMGNDTRLTDSRNAKDVYSWAKASTKPSYTASEVGAIATTAKGANGGVAELDSTGKVPSSQLPSFVDDVLEYDKQSSFPTTGESGKIYIAKDTNKTYRWSGTAYVEISSSLALGETSSTAYRGDRGKIAYDHSQSAHARTDATAVAASSTNGNIKINGTETTVYTHPGSGTNPHGTTKSDVGLGNVGNFKAVSTVASQGLSDTEKSNARANIGAGTSNFSGSYNDLTNKPTIPTVNNATLTIQKNGTNVQTFTANQSTNATANITVPTKVSELTNDKGYTTNTGTVTKITGGTGLDGGDITTSGTLSVKYGTASGTACQGNDSRLSNARQAVDNVLTNQNLNNVTAVGFYSSGGGNTVTNKPSGVDNFGMEVIHDAGGSYYTQILYNPATSKSYRRYCSNGTWDSWTEDKLTDNNTTYSAGSNITLTGTTFSLTKANVTGALGYTPPTADTNTHRPIQVNGTEVLGNNTTALNLKAGSNITLSNSSGTVTIAATNTTYSANNGVGLNGTTFYNSGIRDITINGNYLRKNLNGTNTDLTIPYATTSRITSQVSQVGSDAASSAGWYKVVSGTLTGYSNVSLMFAIHNTSGYESGILVFDLRCDNGTSLTVKKFNWLIRQGYSLGDFIVNTNGNNWAIYQNIIRTQFYRDTWTVIEESSTSGKQASYTLNNSTTKESTAPTATATSVDIGYVSNAGAANKLGSSNVGSSRQNVYLNAGTATAGDLIVAHRGNAGKSNMNDIGRLWPSSGMTNLTDPGNNYDNPMSGTTKSTSWHYYWDTSYSDDPNGSNSWVTQICNKAGTNQWWVRSRGGSAITNGTAWAAPWEHLVVTPQTGQGGTTTPIYIDANGHTQNCSYTIAKSVPSDAKFTDTTYSSKAAASGGTDVSLVTTGEKYTWNNKSNLTIGTTSTTAAAGNHTHGISITTDSGTNQLTMAANTKYKITAGGSSYIFTTPPDTNTNNAVTQTATSTSADYEVLFSVTADNTTRTEGARKNSNLKFNPSTGNLTVTKVNGVSKKYTSGVSCAIGATTCTISDSAITTSSIITPFSSNSSGNVISITNIAVSSGKVILSFEALTEATSFRVEIVN